MGKSFEYKIAIVDNEEGAKAAAIDAAEASLAENKNELRGVKGIFKKVWKHNLAKEYYRQKEIAKAKEKIFKSGNIYAAEQGSKEEHDEAMSAIIDRFTSEYDGMVHTEAGERKDVLDEKTPEQKELKDSVVNLIKDYASGNLDEKTFQEEKIRLFQEASANDKPVLDKSSMYADNLLEIAKQIKANVDNVQKLEEMDLKFDVVVGKAKSGVRTEAHYNKIDKLVDKVSSTKIGSLVNETTVAAAVGATYCLGVSTVQRLASSKLFAWGSFGAATGLSAGIAALKAGKRLEDERKQHARELAQGKTFNKDAAPRREEMEKYRYETQSANDLKNNLETSLYDKEGNLKELTQEELNTALADLAEIEARIGISDKEKIDLISFSNLKKVEQERFNLDVSRAKAKVDLKSILNKRSDLKLPTGDKLESSLNNLTEIKRQELLQGEGGIENLDKLFKKMKKVEMVKTAVKTAVIGVTIGTAAQEVRSMFSADQQGAIERLFDGKSEGKSATFFEGVRRWIVGGDSPRMDGPIHEEIINSGHFKLSEGAALVAGADGTYNLMNGEEMIANNLKVNPDGSLTEEAKQILANNDVIATQNTVTSTIEHPGVVKTNEVIEGMSNEDLIKQKPELFHQVKRDLWFDNNTKAFDKNELKCWWGGEKNTGMDSDGNYVFNVKHMTPGGSYHGNKSIDSQELIKSGGLKMVFSLSRDTQNMVCEVPVDANGNAIIDKNSEIAKLLFKEENGKAKFLGKFAEVVQSMGNNEDGTEKIRMLATHVGEGLDGIDASTIEQIKNITTTEQIQTIFTNLDVPVDAPIDPIPVFPIMPRTPLEKVYSSFGYGYNYFKKGNDEEAKKIRSETLIENPDAELDHYKEAELYINKFSEEYKKEIEELANQAGSMEKTNRLTICMPAAGHQEGKNIYKSLENYTKQTVDPTDYEICILVNHPEVDHEGKKIVPDNTISEIKRFQKDYPDIRVRFMYKVLSPEDAKIGYVRKLLNDTVLYRQHQRGEGAPDLIMVSNDADNEGISPDYVKNFLDKFKTNKEADAMLGQLDWDPAAYIKYPAIHIGTRLFQYIDTIQRHKDKRIVGSTGANFAFRSSIYSAVGGYRKDETLAEDVDLGNRIKSARGWKRGTVEFADSKSRLYTSSRRAIDAWKSGLIPFQQWDKGFSAFDNEVRGFEINKEASSVNFDDKKYLEKLKKELEYVVNETIKKYEFHAGLGGEDHPDYDRALTLLGIKYTRSIKGEIKIENMGRLVKELKRYQKIGIIMRDYKSGKVNKKNFSSIVEDELKDKEKKKSFLSRTPKKKVSA